LFRRFSTLRKGVRGARKFIAPLVAVCVLAAVAAPTPAQAEYNGYYFAGCTYSWGSACYSPYQHVEDTVALDPDHALAYFYPAAISNGYPYPKHDGIERNVCSSVWSNPNVTITYGWACAWGSAAIYPHQWGYPGLGSGTPYYNIALYEYTNF
jgi:hypothetical protein